MNLRKRVDRPALGMAAGTAASRATGLARTITLATVLGVGTVSDAYNTANTAPNMLFALVAGGTLGAALVPTLARHDDADTRRETASAILGTVTVWAAGIAVAMALAAPVLMRLLAAGAGGRADQDELLALGTSWMRMFAPQVVFYAVSVVATGIMSAQRRLALGAAAPVATNAVIIAGALAFAAVNGTRPSPSEVDGRLTLLLGWSTTLAVGAMAAIQLAGARRVIPGLRFAPRWRDPAIRELRAVGGWALLYVTVNQLGIAVVIALASEVDGGVSAYQWAFAVMQLPYAIIAVSIFSAAYPALARIRGEDADTRGAHVRRAATSASALLVPAAVTLVVVADKLAAVVVGPGDRRLVAAALVGFGISLVPFSLFQLLTRASYAHGDARGPALVNIAVNATMLAVDVTVFALVDDPSRLLTGLAAGHAASYVVGCGLLTRLLERKRAVVRLQWGAVLWRPIAAGVVTAGALYWTSRGATDTRAAALATVLTAVLIGAATYAAIGGALGLHRTRAAADA